MTSFDSRGIDATLGPPETFGVHESAWTREETADGRVYFFNRATGASQWHIPNDLYQPQSMGQQPPHPGEGVVAMPGIAKAVLNVDCVTEFLPNKADRVQPSRGTTTSTTHNGVLPTPPPSLLVQVVGARGLQDAGLTPSNIFCTCELFGKADTQVATEVVFSELDPEFNETLDVPQYVNGDIVVLSVLVKDTEHDDQLLGRVMLADQDLQMAGPTELRLEDTPDGCVVFLEVRTQAF
mmetsp:Transcript_47257/g.109342  ORF Transcript_47257/g.109342 Transcript_47257/m.109342 type:complete len:238 (-) Transcript_47257:103-816(-)